ncbi:Uncharacterized RNA-binding protein C660.15 [Seminavis robusta]|uniref:Uncharacterized RNA-binding protein C660.15 n=1 Tax=Seminavis robusta TaxID=568900 RepID=A0A9N8E3G3_9STRA|nr:Uncharacterized RNA-binding protein C660.15 [Seminavis robusta]|eukprot:Sro610_g175170.1 Uncharacterized RNA-binding protein C660.15 (425) ;mRNA; f:42918-44450
MADGSYFAKKPAPSGGALDQGKIFVGGLSWQTTEESLRWHFEQYGPVVSVEVMRDRVTGDPRGFAFVVFREQSTVDLVMAEAKHEINHKIVDVKRAQARGVAPPSIHDGNKQQAASNDRTSQHGSNGSNNTRAPNNNNSGGGGGASNAELTPEQLHNKVFVGGLPAHVDRDEMRKIFEQYGPVVDAIVMIDQVTNRSRCFGFVTFENGSNGAQRAIEKQPLQIGNRSVEVKLATPKAEQKRMPPTSAGPKHVGLRAGMSSSSSSGEYAGLAVAFGRSGWKAGYGSKAFGAAGWAVEGWDDGGGAPPRDGFSFDLLLQSNKENNTAVKIKAEPTDAKPSTDTTKSSNREPRPARGGNNSQDPQQHQRHSGRGDHHQSRDRHRRDTSQGRDHHQGRDSYYGRHDSSNRRYRDQHHNDGPPIKRPRY